MTRSRKDLEKGIPKATKRKRAGNMLLRSGRKPRVPYARPGKGVSGESTNSY